jgi:hypothetical protein
MEAEAGYVDPPAVISQHWRLRQENHEFEVSLDYIERPCFKKKSLEVSYKFT